MDQLQFNLISSAKKGSDLAAEPKGKVGIRKIAVMCHVNVDLDPGSILGSIRILI